MSQFRGLWRDLKKKRFDTKHEAEQVRGKKNELRALCEEEEGKSCKTALILSQLIAERLPSLHQGISSWVSTSRNLPEVRSRVADLITSMILPALSSLEVSGKAIPAPVAAVIPMSVRTNL